MQYKMSLVLVVSVAIVLALVVAVQGAEASVDRRAAPSADPAELSGIPQQVGQPAPLEHTDDLTRTVYLPLGLNSYFAPYMDDFSDPNSGWYTYDDGNIRWSYQSGEYEIMLRDSGWYAWASTPILLPESYIVEADMRRHSGEVYYGLIFGLEDGDHFYLLLVDPDSKTFCLLERGDSGWSALYCAASNYINSGSVTNRLKVKREGNQIDAYINGQLVASESDASYTGMLRGGLYAESGPSTPAIARFDDFQATSVGTVTAMGQGFSSHGMGESAPEWPAPGWSR